MKNFIFLLASLGLLFSCSENLDEKVQQNGSDLEILQASDINAFITESLESGEVFDWATASNQLIYSALIQSDSILALGYTVDPSLDITSFIGTTEKLPSDWIAKRDDILERILETEKIATDNPSLTLEEILPFGLDDVTPTISVVVTSRDVVNELRSNQDIRYVEPMGYEYQNNSSLKSTSGCSDDPDSINPSDYTNTNSYNAKIPWNFSRHNIQDAWAHSTGDNIGIVIIDTGASDAQDNLNSNFASGNSPNRWRQRYSTHYSGFWWWKTLDSPNDQCGHGTAMAGLAAAPWSTDGNSLGVAYRSNLITIRAVNDVIISSSNEKNGVKNALIIAGNRSDMKIVSMSIGNIISSGTVRDGIYYAYNRGKLLLAAAGTSTPFTNFVGVIFPANMSQTTAVTGVKDQSSYNRCNTCHSGSKVDFTIKMQRSYDNNRVSLGLAGYSNTPKYISGSSCATATTAGIAALVWATNPSMSRATIVNRLKNASQNGSNRTSSYGWGNINAKKAVLGQYY